MPLLSHAGFYEGPIPRQRFLEKFARSTIFHDSTFLENNDAVTCVELVDPMRDKYETASLTHEAGKKGLLTGGINRTERIIEKEEWTP
jgi:hypothetical protein